MPFDSTYSSFRQKRFKIFKELIKDFPRPVKVIDIGGTEDFWKQMNFFRPEEIQATIVNLKSFPTTLPNFRSVVADACNLVGFADQEFDVAFSNSVIEHLGSRKNQEKMAREIQRVGKRYYLQTPNRYFPIEPHFMLPFFQFYPRFLKIWLLTHFQISWYNRFSDPNEAGKKVDSIILLSQDELVKLFPDAQIWQERYYGLTKSLVVYY